MSITDVFIRRPVLAICLNLLILVIGIQSIFNLNVRQYPRSDLAVVTVKTAYVGANPEMVRGFVTTPLERAIASADGIDYMESSSSQGVSQIDAHLRLNFDINDALTQVQAKIAQVRNDLPIEAEAPTIDVQTADNRFASMYLSFFSESLDQNQITDYLTRVVQPKLSAVPGVQRADILGARTFAMRIWLKSDRLAAYKLAPTDVRNALLQNNYLSALGSTKGALISVNLTSNTDLKSREEFEQLVIKQEGTSLVRLGDVADVVLGAENYDEEVRFSGQTATFMGIWALPNANALDVIKAVRDEIPAIEAQLPTGMKVGIPYDATNYIRNALREVFKTLGETILIVMVVIFLFIGSLRSTIVPIVAIPLSLIGVTAIIMLMGFTINLLTLLAIVLAVGLVVDDAIVILENVERYVSEGMAPRDAAVKAGRELAVPVIAMTITLAAVYAPIGIQGGLTGALFREFAFTLAGAVLISGVVALTLSPVLSSMLVRKKPTPTKLQLKVGQAFSSLRENYRRLLTAILNYRPLVITAAIVLGLCIFPLYLFSVKELAPREDQGIVFGIIQAAANSSLDATVASAETMQPIFESFPEYAQSFMLMRPDGGFSGMLLKPWKDRSRTVEEIEGEAWGKTSNIPGLRVIMTSPPPLPGGSDFPVEMVISSTADPIQLVESANQLVGTAFASGQFMFADTDLKYDFPQAEIEFDRDRVAALGLNLRDVGSDLSTLIGGDYVNRFNIQGRSYKVIPQLKRSLRLNPQQLLDTYIRTPSGEMVPVATVASVREQTIPRKLNRFQQLNSAKIQGAVPPGVTIDKALNVLEEKAAQILPFGSTIDYAGESRQLRKEGNALTQTLILSFVFIFLVLASQFESFSDPFIILLGSVPLALAGALIFVFLNFTTLNIYSQVGLVTLVGLVSKNGILIVEFANHLQESGLGRREAVIEAACTRLRPIMMTSIATVVGHFPLVIATGAGAGARNSIGAVLVTGMVIGTLLTLFVVPVIYSLVASEHKKI
jgi:multidrug efflux pump